jgi:hypothetical protein
MPEKHEMETKKLKKSSEICLGISSKYERELGPCQLVRQRGGQNVELENQKYRV